MYTIIIILIFNFNIYFELNTFNTILLYDYNLLTNNLEKS
jgi:hypothetical protein